MMVSTGPIGLPRRSRSAHPQGPRQRPCIDVGDDVDHDVDEMKTVQMTLDVELVAAVDRVVRRMKTTRSAFTREALRSALAAIETRELERRHRAGYLKHPPKKDEFGGWDKAQAWGDD